MDEQQRIYQQNIHQKALAAYGNGTCACCGTTENLSLDHIGGEGAEHREELFGNRRAGGYRFYLWLKRNGYPPGYQVLCRRCNHSKAKTGRCQLLHHGPEGFKRCSHPQHEGANPLPLESFYRNRTASDGRQTKCKSCWQRDDLVRRPRKGYARGERNVTRAVMTREIVLECRRRVRDGEKQSVLVREYGVSASAISEAIRRVTWAWLE